MDALTSLTLTDWLLIFLLGVMVLVGFYQGVVRQLLGIAGWIVSFVVAAHLAPGLADWLGQYWTQFVPAYVDMLAFGILFITLFVIANVLTQISYKRQTLTDRISSLDEVLGAVLAVGLGMLVIGSAVAILETYYGLG